MKNRHVVIVGYTNNLYLYFVSISIACIFRENQQASCFTPVGCAAVRLRLPLSVFIPTTISQCENFYTGRVGYLYFWIICPLLIYTMAVRAWSCAQLCVAEKYALVLSICSTNNSQENLRTTDAMLFQMPVRLHLHLTSCEFKNWKCVAVIFKEGTLCRCFWAICYSTCIVAFYSTNRSRAVQYASKLPASVVRAHGKVTARHQLIGWFLFFAVSVEWQWEIGIIRAIGVNSFDSIKLKYDESVKLPFAFK